METNTRNPKRLALTIIYDGSEFFGWQKTKMGPSVEGALEKALSTLLGKLPLRQIPRLIAASRTDSGVHAHGQIVALKIFSKISPQQLLYRLNCILPKTIRILAIEEKPPKFHPTIDAKSKTYVYRIETGEILSPFDRKFVWHYPYPLDLSLMQRAAQKFIGEKDFAAFGNIPKHPKTIRKVLDIAISQRKSQYTFCISGESFLYKMVRNIVGTLVYIGRGKLSLEKIEIILEKKLRKNAGVSAPAHGLSLKQVYY